MGLKDLFFINEDQDKIKESEKRVTTFPSENNNFKNNVPASLVMDEIGQFNFGKPNFGTTKQQGRKSTKPLASCESHIGKVVEMYENGFTSLNIQGYDFYELYKAVQSAGIDNPLAYKMAFDMGKGMDSSVTKASLLAQSDYYLTEIEKVYKDYATSGKDKKSNFLSNKQREKDSLLKEKSDLTTEIQRLEQQLSAKETALSMIDQKYSTQLEDLDCKILANDIAKSKIVESIQQVVNGIKTNIN